MRCRRCDGLLIEIQPLRWSRPDYLASPCELPYSRAWECVNCGNYIDAVILANQAAGFRSRTAQGAGRGRLHQRVKGH